MIDIIIIGKENLNEQASVIDLGVSDQLAQVIKINTDFGNLKPRNKKIERRNFTQKGIEIFKNLLYNESWEEVCGQLDVKDSVKAFMEVFLLHFEMAFPYKTVALGKITNGKCLSEGLLTLRKRMKHLNHIRRTFSLSQKDLEYIKKYQSIYKKIIREVKKRGYDRYIASASNKSRAIWKIINKESGKMTDDDYDRS